MQQDNKPIIESIDDVLEFYGIVQLNRPALTSQAYQKPESYIELVIGKTRARVKNPYGISPIESIHYQADFYGIATSVLQLLGDFDPRKFGELLIDKHKRYGASPIRAWGNVGLMIRIDSKMQRYLNQVAQDMPEGDESLRDTLQDIFGYCVIGYWFNKRS